MKKSKKTQQPYNYDSFIQTLQNLRREADENTKKEQMDEQETNRKLREEIHTAVGYLKMKYDARQVSFEEAKDYFPFNQGHANIRWVNGSRCLELQMAYDECIPIDEFKFLIAPRPGKSMYAKQIKNGVVFMLTDSPLYGTLIYIDGNDDGFPWILSITYILEHEEPPEFLPPELAQKIKKKPIVETNQDDSLQYKKGKKYKKKNKFEIEIF